MSIASTASGARIAWDAFGDPRLPPMVLIQGLGAQMIGWRPGFCERLAREGLYVIRFDNRDVGQSQRYPQGGYTLAALADDTAALLDALAMESAHIVGQSMGGIVAQLLWQRHPQRLRSLGLIYTATSKRHARGIDAIAAREARKPPTTREAYAAYYLEGEAICASPGYPQDLAWLTELGGRIWDRGWDASGGERQMQAVLAQDDLDDNARSIRLACTIIAGDGDQLVDPAASTELHRLIPGSTLRIFPGMGHELPQPLWGDIAGLLAASARAASAGA
ncbi:alpha/beta fold hydrolase [Solimonas terrae]|uniref:Alpha/beta hydrolase n=1 Tax=Solimonas terrae TaxID=1396819 RepID=A0A6M2BML9_9GAMM|nr:alpha/beta hydrolase [Solimonas terrae]NGY03263.1 alpha/beta hydrolase [Solimonas terrae]